MRSTLRFLAIISLAWLAVVGVETSAQGRRLQADLTPLGGEKAANAAGTIPAWDGGITKAPAGYVPGQHYVDPYAADKPLFTITQQNVDQYAAKLSDGHKAMLKTYATFKMNVYPDAAQRVAPAAHLRRHGQEHRPRQAGERRQRRRGRHRRARRSRCRRAASR